MVIVRVFRAITHAGMDAEFEHMFKEQSMPMVHGRDGLIASYFGRPTASNHNEFVAVTVWRDLDALRAFAGADWEQAVIPEEERRVLQQTFITHYESLG